MVTDLAFAFGSLLLLGVTLGTLTQTMTLGKVGSLPLASPAKKS